MSARKITVSIECCDADTGDMQIAVEDPDNPDGFRYQDMHLHPMTCHLVHEMLGFYKTQGAGIIRSHNLNVLATIKAGIDAEREACAQLAEQLITALGWGEKSALAAEALQRAADLIRARTTT